MRRLGHLVTILALAVGGAGCSGDDGTQGAEGAQGADGAKGAKGASGADGANGADGADGAKGAKGANGADGTDGTDGATGSKGERGLTGSEGREDLTNYVVASGSGRTIMTGGGKGTSGNGGDGEYVEAYNYNANDPIKVLKEGSPNTAFTVPTYPPYLGDNPKTVTADATWSVGNGLTAGSNLVLGDDGATSATGLSIAAGVTLTIAPNHDTDNADTDGDAATGTLETLVLTFANGVQLDGELVVGKQDGTVQGDGTSLDSADVTLVCGFFVSSANSTIDISGADAPSGANGGDAGRLILNTASNETGGVVIASVVDGTGGDGDRGGAGAEFRLNGAAGTIYVTGTVDTSGGAGSAGFGGDGGEIRLNADSDASGGNYISGTIMAHGGDGTIGGGDGGFIGIETARNGAVVIASEAIIDSRGGDATTDGPGGLGNGMEVYAASGTMRIAGSFMSGGGQGAGAGDGGDGGDLYFEASAGDYPENNNAGGYGIYIGAPMNTVGGDGASGGDGGYVSIYNYGQADDGAGQYGVEPTMLLGYAAIDASGGDGTASGGQGGSTCYLETYERGSDANGDRFAAGDIVNEVPWTSNGGKGGTANGGDGGEITFYTDYSYHLPVPPVLTNSGALTSNGGGSTALGGGDGGYIQMYALDTVHNSAAISNNGGEGAVSGGDGGGMEIKADYELINEAALSSLGGAGGTGNGGLGGHVELFSRFLTSDGDIMIEGGASTDGSGGDADYLDVRSTELPASLSGHLYAGGGASTNASSGRDANVWLSAFQVALDGNGELEF